MAHLRVVPAKRAWLEALAESDEAFTALTGIPVEPGWMAEFPGIVRYCLQRLDAGDDPAWSIHLFFDTDHGGALVGNGGWKGAPVDGVAELGYAVAPACRNRGIASGAVAVLLAQASAAGLHTVVAHTLREPSASTRVLERSGFRHVGDEHEDGVPVWRWERPVRPDDPVQMHVDEVDTDADLVRRLLRAQHPQWADLPITRVPSAGTDNAMYRLGDDLVARLPRIDWAVDNVAKEQRWLPMLAPHLPLAVPLPGGRRASRPRSSRTRGAWRGGCPAAMATLDGLDDPVQAARDLAAFVRALREVDPTDGPRHNAGRVDPPRRPDGPRRHRRARRRGGRRRPARGVGRGRRGARARRSAHLVPRRPLLPERPRHRRPGVRRSSTGAPAGWAIPPST